MADIINLLPDNIANQIAAGEVIQRPASAVKELLENAVDAGATEIQLIIKDAGKELVQVIDNGGGMSEADARMCFERHATSKIQSIEDLFQIRTMGFRGEALASIAAVAQVELKTRKKGAEAGTYVEIDNSLVKKQEPCQTAEGTSIAMKNLFFNVPARRNFLKSNAAEMRHIVDEFIRVAMAYPQLQFSLTSNNQQLFHLDKGSLKQRIIAILGQHYNARLVNVKESTDYMNVYGFVGKPETAKKTRGDQFFFVNNRFIKSPYLHHAVMNAFADIIPADSYPLYVLFIDVNPEHVDINVHPTKQEIKFDDEKVMYAFVQATVKHALAQFNVTATLDFDLDPNIQALDAVSKPFTAQQQEEYTHSPLYKSFTQANQAHMIDKSSSSSNLKHWKDLYESSKNTPETDGYTISSYTVEPAAETRPAVTYESQPHATASVIDERWQDTATDQKVPVQVHQQFILSQIKSGFILIDQQAAHERILFERYQRALEETPMATQQSLFPQTLQLPPADAVLVTEMLPELQALGYELEPFGNHTFVVRGTPADMQSGNDQATIEGLIEQFKNFSELKINRREQLVRSMARNNAIPAGKILSAREMQNMIDELFACSMPNVAPSGKFTFISFKLTDLARMFERGN